jgi:hypothetical protein
MTLRLIVPSGSILLSIGNLRIAFAWKSAVRASEAFLADPDAQDAAFRAFTLQNHATLSRLSRRYREMPRTEQLGILGYAHNQGAGGAIDYLRTGTAGRDGFGTNPEIYITAVRNGLSAGQTQTQEGEADAS